MGDVRMMTSRSLQYTPLQGRTKMCLPTVRSPTYPQAQKTACPHSRSVWRHAWPAEKHMRSLPVAQAPDKL